MGIKGSLIPESAKIVHILLPTPVFSSFRATI
jgi:hypothetical protein